MVSIIGEVKGGRNSMVWEGKGGMQWFQQWFEIMTMPFLWFEKEECKGFNGLRFEGGKTWRVFVVSKGKGEMQRFQWFET
jgi:hypothetical protein